MKACRDTYAHIRTNIYAHTHICTHTYTYTHKHTHTHGRTGRKPNITEPMGEEEAVYEGTVAPESRHSTSFAWVTNAGCPASS